MSLLEENRALYQALIDQMQAEEDLIQKEQIARQAIAFATKNVTGYYSSSAIEKVYLQLAQSLSVEELSDSCSSNSTLHVVTQCYDTGGHSRVIERWLTEALGEEKSSVFYSEPPLAGVQINQRIEALVKKSGGQVYSSSESADMFQNAQLLRDISSGYQRVIVHVHMHDTLPLLAYGVADFKTTVFHYNHADHLFWVGISVADVILETRTWGKLLTSRFRGRDDSVVLGIPQSRMDSNVNVDKKHARTKLGLPPNAKIIVSAASSHKYQVSSKINYIEMIAEILDRVPHSIFYCIGPCEGVSIWKSTMRRYAKQIVLMDEVSHEKLCLFFRASDLCLDSYPLAGGTTMLDVLTIGCPFLSLKSPAGQLDSLIHSPAYCDTKEQLVDKALSLLLSDDDPFVEKFVNETRKAIVSYDGLSVWNVRRLDIQEESISYHKITEFREDFVSTSNDLNELLLESHYRKILRSSYFRGFIIVFAVRSVRRYYIKICIGRKVISIPITFILKCISRLK